LRVNPNGELFVVISEDKLYQPDWKEGLPNMPSKRSSNDLVLFSSEDPRQLVRWLCDSYGMQTILQEVAQYRPSGGTAEAPTKRAYKKRASKKGGAKKGSKEGSAKKGSKKGGTKKGSSKKGGKRGRPRTQNTGPGGAGETGNG
jgi:hypothetical protein